LIVPVAVLVNSVVPEPFITPPSQSSTPEIVSVPSPPSVPKGCRVKLEVLGTIAPAATFTTPFVTLTRPGMLASFSSVHVPPLKSISEPAVVPPKLPVAEPPPWNESVPELDSTVSSLTSETPTFVVPAPAVFSNTPWLRIDGVPPSLPRLWSTRTSNTPSAALTNSLVPPIPNGPLSQRRALP
jgi:hypothetical protein